MTPASAVQICHPQLAIVHITSFRGRLIRPMVCKSTASSWRRLGNANVDWGCLCMKQSCLFSSASYGNVAQQVEHVNSVLYKTVTAIFWFAKTVVAGSNPVIPTNPDSFVKHSFLVVLGITLNCLSKLGDLTPLNRESIYDQV